MPIDYERMNKLYPKQKAALTRALKVANLTDRQAAVIATCKIAVSEWESVGGWPDGWSRWQRALGDVGVFTNLEDYVGVTAGW